MPRRLSMIAGPGRLSIRLKFAKQIGDVPEVETFLEGWLKRRRHMKANGWDGYRKITGGKLYPLVRKAQSVGASEKAHARPAGASCHHQQDNGK